ELPVLYKVLKLQSKKADIGTIQVSSLVFTSSNFVAYAVNKNLPVSTWGEGILLLTLHVIIANLLCLNSGRHRYAVVFMVLYVIVMVVLLWPLVSDQVLSGLMLLNIPINIFRKSRRVFNTQSQKGETRFPSRRFIFLTNFCSLGRLLTTMADTTDLLFHTYSIVDCALNIILALVTISSWIKRNKLSKNRASPAG
ncbi:uncharacterized protein LOC131931139, partial [Physella acuta]|uniref:uncharacterized protein LOC131931139 n=1 Tax=Physella acuta TaxID=109671 RepID=UPI0027DDD2B4